MPGTAAAQFEHRMTKLTSEVRRAPRTATIAASATMKTAIVGSLHQAAPSGRLSGVGKAGAKLSVSYRLAGGIEHTTSLVYANGPWQLIENPTAAHMILPRGGTRVSRAVASLFGQTVRGGKGPSVLGSFARSFGPVAFSHTRGTHGKRPWHKGVDVGRPAAVRILNGAFLAAAKRGFT